MVLNKFITFASLMALCSCSQMQFREQALVKKDEFRFNPLSELSISGNALDEMVASAKASGAKAVEFLATDFYIKGNDASMRGDSQVAIIYLKHALDLSHGDSYIQKKLSYEYIRMGNIQAAEGLLADLFLKSNYKDETIGQVLGGVYTTLEKKKEAYHTYKKILALNPKSEETCLYLARLYVGDKQYSEATNLIKSCNSGDEKSPSLAFFLGKMEYDRKNKVLAKKYFEESLKIDSTYSQGALAIGALFEEKEDYAKAIATYKKFISIEENAYDAPILQRLVTVLLSLEENKEVITFAERLLHTESADLNLKVRLGLLYSDEKRFDDAISLFKLVLEEVPTSDKIQYYLGALYQQTSSFDEAIRYYNLIKSESPLFGDAGLQIGQLLSMRAREGIPQSMLGPSEKFTKYIEERSKINPEMAVELKMLKATFFEETYQLDKAIESLDSVKNHKSFSDSHRYFLASIYERNGQYNEARKLIEAILEKDSNNAHALNFLGYSYVDRNENMDKAFEYISKAIALNPDDGYIRDSMAWYYFKVGQFDKALVEAIKAHQLVSSDPTITKHLGMIYHELSHYDNAQKYLTESLKQTQAPAEREDVLKLLTDIESKRSPASIP